MKCINTDEEKWEKIRLILFEHGIVGEADFRGGVKTWFHQVFNFSEPQSLQM